MDIRKYNPFFEDHGLVVAQAVAGALQISRASQASRALLQARSLLGLLHQAQWGAGSALANRIQHVSHFVDLRTLVSIPWTLTRQGASALAETLGSRRHYAGVAQGCLVLDPRFLIAEYVFDILLRDRQVCTAFEPEFNFSL